MSTEHLATVLPLVTPRFHAPVRAVHDPSSVADYDDDYNTSAAPSAELVGPRSGEGARHGSPEASSRTDVQSRDRSEPRSSRRERRRHRHRDDTSAGSERGHHRSHHSRSQSSRERASSQGGGSRSPSEEVAEAGAAGAGERGAASSLARHPSGSSRSHARERHHGRHRHGGHRHHHSHHRQRDGRRGSDGTMGGEEPSSASVAGAPALGSTGSLLLLEGGAGGTLLRPQSVPEVLDPALREHPRRLSGDHGSAFGLDGTASVATLPASLFAGAAGGDTGSVGAAGFHAGRRPSLAGTVVSSATVGTAVASDVNVNPYLEPVRPDVSIAPAAVEQWVMQNFPFRVLFMNACLEPEAAPAAPVAAAAPAPPASTSSAPSPPAGPAEGAGAGALSARPSGRVLLPPLTRDASGAGPAAARSEPAAGVLPRPLAPLAPPVASTTAVQAPAPALVSEGAGSTTAAVATSVPAAPLAPRLSTAASGAQAPPPRPQVIMAMLFADIVGYSKLQEMQVLVFVEQFLGAVADLMESLPRRQQPVVRNTWGDAIYGVWKRVPDAGKFALLLSDLVLRVPWHEWGLPRGLNIRISLHAAPVHPVVDPVTRVRNYTGVHTSRAARIEPVTPPGCVYCSQAFAAISETLSVAAYETQYVGNVPLAKRYGVQPVYHVRWANTLYKEQSPRHVQQVVARSQRSSSVHMGAAVGAATAAAAALAGGPAAEAATASLAATAAQMTAARVDAGRAVPRLLAPADVGDAAAAAAAAAAPRAHS
jgi:hypothetical protein